MYLALTSSSFSLYYTSSLYAVTFVVACCGVAHHSLEVGSGMQGPLASAFFLHFSCTAQEHTLQVHILRPPSLSRQDLMSPAQYLHATSTDFMAFCFSHVCPDRVRFSTK